MNRLQVGWPGLGSRRQGGRGFEDSAPATLAARVSAGKFEPVNPRIFALHEFAGKNGTTKLNQ